MKLFSSSILIVTVFTLFGFSKSEEQDMYLKSVFNSVKGKDFSGFKKLMISSTEFMALTEKTTWSPEKKELVKRRITQEYLDKKTEENFEEIMKKSDETGFMWANAIVDSTNYNERIKEGLQEMRFTIYISSGKKRGRLSADKCLKTDNGWKLSNGLGFYSEIK